MAKQHRDKTTMVTEIDDLVSDISKLVSLPEISMQVTTMVDDPDVTIDQIGKVISQDPGLTAKILKISNSAMYGFVSQVDTVSRAITLLGTRQIRDIVLATAAFDTFKGIANDLVTMEDFWYHSILCGLAANRLAHICGLRNSDGLFVAGLLHDIGQLIMFNRLPEQSQQAILLSMEGTDNLEMHEAEDQVLGFNHMDVGMRLAESWHLPPFLTYCIGYHHHPEQSPDYKLQVSIIQIANSIAVMAELNSTDLEVGPKIDDFAWQQTGLDSSKFAELIEKILAEYDEIATLLKL